MKLFRITFLVLVIIGLFNSAYADDPGKFKVGVIAPLSGALAEYGLASKNGIGLAIEEHPELFSNINFIFEDSHWDAKTAVTSYIKLTQADKVNLVYNWGNPTSEALAPIAERSKMPLLAMSYDEKISQNNQYTIRTLNMADDFAKKLAEHINGTGYKNIGVILADNTYLRGLLNGIRKYLSEDVSLEEIESYPIDSQDFKSSVVKIRSRKYDYLGVFLISGQISNFYKQLRQQGVKVPSFGSDFFESSTEIKLAEGGMENTVYPHLGLDNRFYEHYMAKYKNDYQISFAGNAYDMAMLIGKLFSSSNSKKLNSSEILTRLKSPDSINGVCGEFKFMDDAEAGSHFHFPIKIKKIESGKIWVLQ